MNSPNDLRDELLRMRQEDQSAEYSPQNAARRASRLKEIVAARGWPSAGDVGEDGELAVFLIVQHSNEIPLQKEYLRFLEEHPRDDWLWKEHVALLTDRILVNEGKPQIYGTQFRDGEPFPMAQPATLDERRTRMGLQPSAEYAAAMRRRQRRA